MRMLPVARLKTASGKVIGFNESDILASPDDFKKFEFVSGSEVVAALFAPTDDVWADGPAIASTNPPEGMEFKTSSTAVVKPIRAVKKGGR